MAVIASAYFTSCSLKGCTVAVAHGAIFCTSGYKLSCYSKATARVGIDALLQRNLITEIEKLALLEQINNSQLQEMNEYPALLFAPEGSLNPASAAPTQDRMVMGPLDGEMPSAEGDIGHTLH